MRLTYPSLAVYRCLQYLYIVHDIRYVSVFNTPHVSPTPNSLFAQSSNMSFCPLPYSIPRLPRQLNICFVAGSVINSTHAVLLLKYRLSLSTNKLNFPKIKMCMSKNFNCCSVWCTKYACAFVNKTNCRLQANANYSF